MKKNTVKKNWEKPELIAIVRSRSEESVLRACKSSTSARGCGNETGGPAFQIASS